MQTAVKVVLYLFLGALVVLVVTHASGFATATSAVGGQLTNDAYLLSGGGISTNAQGGTTGNPPGSWKAA